MEDVKIQQNTWIKYYKKPKLKDPIAVAGSPGLRSIGKIVIDSLVKKIKPDLMAELYSTHFPLIYQTKPSYASNPWMPGICGVNIESGKVDFPKIKFYFSASPPMIITSGYHANFAGQYEVAERVLDFYEEFQVKRMIVLAGFGLDGRNVCCAATSQQLIKEMKEKYGIETSYKGPFYGFSGLVFGLAKKRNIEALCLFGKTKPIPDKPEEPDELASKNLLMELARILNLNLFNNLEKRPQKL